MTVGRTESHDQQQLLGSLRPDWHVCMHQMMAIQPVNSVRNMAMLLARTDLILPLDVDLVVSRDLSRIVRDPERCGSVATLPLAQLLVRWSSTCRRGPSWGPMTNFSVRYRTLL